MLAFPGLKGAWNSDEYVRYAAAVYVVPLPLRAVTQACGWETVTLAAETIEKRLEQRLVRYRPILYVHAYILGYILRPFGGRVGPPCAGP